MNDEFFMRRCIQLAMNGLGTTYPNPIVGCVITHGGKIIGEGYHKKAGEPHAEINAIHSVKDPSLLPEATIYVSLEPCAHYGKTPPCALKIIETGFRRVVIGTQDSFEQVSGKGISLIKNAGIEVVSGVLEKECRVLNKRFFTFHNKKRPYIILKWAQSGDGFLDKDFKPYPISNALSKQLVHLMRTEENAILIGTQTALNDDPELTAREIKGKNPVRIIIDFDLKIPNHYKIYNNDSATIILNSVREERAGHISFIKMNRENFMQDLMSVLFSQNIQSVLVEGGRRTLQSFLDAGFWDEIFIIKNPGLKLETGTLAPKMNIEPRKILDFKGNSIEHFWKDVEL